MKPSPKILVIDDEPQILRALKTILVSRSYQVLVARNGEEGIALAAAQQPDVIILDLGLPDLDGVEVCRRIREWTQTPIIVLSVRDSEREKVQALDQGADDYLTKPFGIDELIARLRVALRHSVQVAGENLQPIIHSGPLVIDLLQHKVMRNGEEMHLTATEYKLLAYMARNAGRVLSHQAILEHTWGSENRDRVEYLRVYIRQLRLKLEEDPEHPIHIINEPGIGYRFLAEG
jgi:two-component system, OmpR family, KDP operon response regulator KdpE